MTIEDLLGALKAFPHGAIDPNEEQRFVMEYNDGPLWVIAGPGTGKTLALVLRCLFLLCVVGIPPASIILTTFTKKAAQELKQRLYETLRRLATFFPEVGQIDISHMRIGTLHSLCWDLITASLDSPYRHLQMLDGRERLFFIYAYSYVCREREMNPDLLNLLAWAENPDDPKRPEYLPSRWERAEIFVRLLQRLAEDRVDSARLVQHYDPYLTLLPTVLDEYKEALCRHHFTDFTFVQQQALEWLLSTQGVEFLQGNQAFPGIRHVIVDEYQDTNPLQAELYRALAALSPHHLCVVGDDDQALYRFRGGTVTCMVRFVDECIRAWPGCTV